MTFRQSRSIYAGMTVVELQAALASAQAASIALQTGQQVAKVSYGEGGGMKSVDYRASNLGALTQMILELQACLGLRRHARRAIGATFA